MRFVGYGKDMPTNTRVHQLFLPATDITRWDKLEKYFDKITAICPKGLSSILLHTLNMDDNCCECNKKIRNSNKAIEYTNNFFHTP